MFNQKNKSSILDSANSNSLFGKGTIINGDIQGEGDIRIDGNLNGNVHVSGKLIIGESATLKGDIKADHVEVYGRTFGTIHVKGLLCIRTTGVVEGDLHIGELQIEKSGIFKGTSHMSLPGSIIDISHEQLYVHEKSSAIAIAK